MNHQHQQPSKSDSDSMMSTIIDMETIENQKENIQPLSSGRSAAQLSSLFNTITPTTHHDHHHKNTMTTTMTNNNNNNNNNMKPSSSSSSLVSINTSTNPTNTDGDTPTTTHHSNFNPIILSDHLRQTHLKFQHQIQLLETVLSNPNSNLNSNSNSNSTQPIINFKYRDQDEERYVRWTIDSYPSGGTTAESKLIPLLEQATRKFVRWKRYAQDLRYLKLWIYYSHQVSNRSARTIFGFLIHHQIGTSFSLLYEAYSQLFDHHPIRSSDDQLKLEQILRFGIAQTTSPENQKLVNRLLELETLKSSSEDSCSTIQKAVTKQMINSTQKNKIKVFDDFLSPPSHSHLPGPPAAMITQWDHLGTVNENRKEDKINPTAWRGQKLPMKPQVLSNRTTKMKIYEDHPLTEQEPDSSNEINPLSSSIAPTHILSEQPFTLPPPETSSSSSFSNDYELLKTDPFRYHAFEDLNH